MALFQYEILNPVTNAKKPHLDKGFFIVPAIGKRYKYFVEVAKYNQSSLQKEYYLLLSTEKFDDNCRTCRIDDYGRLKLKPRGEFAEVLTDIAKDVGNISFNYIESADSYDVWKIDY